MFAVADCRPICTHWTTIYHPGIRLAQAPPLPTLSPPSHPSTAPPGAADGIAPHPPLPRRPLPDDGGSSAAPPVSEHKIAVSASEAHVYTECARIWNPIHTEVTALAARPVAPSPLVAPVAPRQTGVLATASAVG